MKIEYFPRKALVLFFKSFIGFDCHDDILSLDRKSNNICDPGSGSVVCHYYLSSKLEILDKREQASNYKDHCLGRLRERGFSVTACVNVSGTLPPQQANAIRATLDGCRTVNPNFRNEGLSQILDVLWQKNIVLDTQILHASLISIIFQLRRYYCLERCFYTWFSRLDEFQTLLYRQCRQIITLT